MAPLRQIAENAGKDGAVVVQNVLAKSKAGYGYNAATDVYEDLVEAGQGDAPGTAERGIGGEPVAHHRRDRKRAAERAGPRPRWRRRPHALSDAN
jgi:hypothetical protein